MDERFLRRTKVERKVALSKATIYRKIAAGTFPRPYRVGSTAVRWRLSDLNEWLRGHIAATDAAND